MTQLKKVLGPFHLWGMAVGLVISGEYFGWSYGWSVAGTGGFLVATLLVATLYTALIFSFTELTTSIPQAAGPFAYAGKAFGRWGAILAGLTCLIEFLFAPPAIAFALGSYTHFIFPSISVLQGAISIFMIFCFLNLWGVKQTLNFELVITVIAVLELVVFLILVLPHFQWSYFWKDPFPKGVSGIFSSIPYAIWFFLAIEGVAMAAEEVKDPKRNIPIGYLSGLSTLIFLALGVMLAAGGVGDWKTLSTMDYPIPEAFAMALGREHYLVKPLAGIGLFGLVASLHGIIFSSSRQVYALAKVGLLPEFISTLHHRHHSPQKAVYFTMFVGIVCLLSGKTSELITLSAMGAVVMYALSMLAVFSLRKKFPRLPHPFKVPFYPYSPAIALVLSVISFVSMVIHQQTLAMIFFLILGVGVLFFLWRLKKRDIHFHTNGPHEEHQLSEAQIL
jgi:ethanolamine permease